MLALNDVGMAAPAMELDSPFHVREVGLVVETDVPFGEKPLGFHEALVVASALEAVRVRNVGQGPRAGGPG